MAEYYDLVYAPELGEFGKVDLYLPDTDAPVPLVIYFHGGGLEGGTRRDQQATFRRLAENGVASASVEYRLYRFGSGGLAENSPRFPDYLLDCARAAAWIRETVSARHPISEFYLSGTSAGGYISMMLLLDPKYLGKHGLAPADFAGYLLDDGQPTVHYNILRERGLDNRLVRLDEAAPLYWADASLNTWPAKPKISILYAEKDIVNRAEQNELFFRTLLHFGYPADRIRIRCVAGYGHSGYCGDPDVFAPMFMELIDWK